jgi:colanic acid/amylovoran biosynthesis glycosyltransferase
MNWLHFGFATMAIHSEHVAKAINAKMAVSLRGYDIALYPRDHPNCYKILWNHVDKVHVLSNDLLNLAYENGMKQHTLFQKITPAIDIKKFSSTLTRLYDFDTIRFTTIARLHWKKGIIETIQALRLLKNKNIKFEYTVIGSGGEFDIIIDVINTLELSDNVKLVGQLGHDEIIDYLNKTDVYLQYSISEGFCNALLEAQSIGLLCIASDAEGLNENILHEQTGWIVTKNNPEQLADTIIKVINLPLEKKRKVSETAKERVRVHFNLELQKKAFKAFYEN